MPEFTFTVAQAKANLKATCKNYRDGYGTYDDILNAEDMLVIAICDEALVQEAIYVRWIQSIAVTH